MLKKEHYGLLDSSIFMGPEMIYVYGDGFAFAYVPLVCSKLGQDMI